MELDKQINLPRCHRCNIQWSNTNPLVYITNKVFCGSCASKIMEQMNNIWLEEAMRRVND